MIAALDVHYRNTTAYAAAIVFDEWQSDSPRGSHTATEEPVADYESGKFYMRELSPLLKVIAQLDTDVHTYVIDGYCHLTADFAPGLGFYLHDSLPKPTVIVGVAKNRYRDSDHAVEVFRGSSKRPLFVTAVGVDYDVAGQLVCSMGGQFRIPTMLKAVDSLARTEIPKSTSKLTAGQFWAVPITKRRIACGRILQLHTDEIPTKSRMFFGGLHDWQSNEEPTSESIAGCGFIDFGLMHIKAVTTTGGAILGQRDLELDGINMPRLMSAGMGPDAMILNGSERVRQATEAEWGKHPVLSTWGYRFIAKLAKTRLANRT